jgi:16S rRNA (cytosine1402-N4)-methyltransferase
MYHEPVLAREVMERLVTSPGGLYLDCTMGGGGHSRAILDRLDESGRLLALDWDEDAHAHVRAQAGAESNQMGEHQVLGRDSRVTLLRHSFGELDRLPAPWQDLRFTGILMDLGLSSHQIDTPARGFSYRFDGPLDMRMDRRRPRDAGHLLDEVDEAALGRLLRDLGEVREWRRLAPLMLAARRQGGLASTGQLRDLVEGKLGRRGSYDLLSRIFQALRMAVNDEHEALEQGLDEAFRRLAAGGRLAVITYHSLEDRLVKTRFRRWSGEAERPGSRHLPVALPPRLGRLLERRGVVPGPDEAARNPRSRSARLRVIERMEA